MIKSNKYSLFYFDISCYYLLIEKIKDEDILGKYNTLPTIPNNQCPWFNYCVT
jgi:hypothetical protein